MITDFHCHFQIIIFFPVILRGFQIYYYEGVVRTAITVCLVKFPPPWQ
jgi:hypothetical protein